MEQKAIMQLLENMYKTADEMCMAANNKYAEANHPESEHYMIRDLFYEDLKFFKGYKQGISNVLNNIRTYYCEDDVQNLKLKSAAPYGATCYSDTDVLETEAKDESEV